MFTDAESHADKHRGELSLVLTSSSMVSIASRRALISGMASGHRLAPCKKHQKHQTSAIGLAADCLTSYTGTITCCPSGSPQVGTAGYLQVSSLLYYARDVIVAADGIVVR